LQITSAIVTTLLTSYIILGGTEQAYSFIDFNPKGNLLASVGSAPDYMLTVWDWNKENIMLRSKVMKIS